MEDDCLSYSFATGAAPSAPVAAENVGNKAANLMRMAAAGLPVPVGFAMSTRMCREYYARGGRPPADFSVQLTSNIAHIERTTGLTFGGSRRPLLVSVRSGAPVSMPGMMDTILNVGLCDRTVSPLLRMTGNPRFVWDTYRRLVQAYGEVVHGLPASSFDHLLHQRLSRESAKTSNELDAFALRTLTTEFLELYASRVGRPFPQDPLQQLASATEAVFRSWNSRRALEYRRLHGIDANLGTAVTVQAMVFGNMGSTSGSGVAFTRDPTSGDKELYLDFLWNAQGEDVVSGRQLVKDGAAMMRLQPELERHLRQLGDQLEGLFGDVQDFEFTIQEGRLYLLQSRAAKRTAWAALRIACDMVDEGLIDMHTALDRLVDYDLDALRMTRLAPTSAHDLSSLAIGVPASPGVAVGQIALDPQTAVRMASEGGSPILVRQDVSTDDVAGMAASAGLLTRLGGRTSHAAVVARQMNKVCVVGCRDIQFEGKRACIGNHWFTEGDFVSLDGHSGRVYAGQLEVVTERPVRCLAAVEQWRGECT